jgi:undecaprenyl-diphosphatase
MAQGFLSSFPSGHTIAATVFWGLLPPLVYVVTHSRRLWLASIPLAILVLGGVGLSRIYLNDHWLSDVIGGYLGGAMFFFAAEWALRHPTRSKNRAAATALAGMGRRDVGVES